MQLGFVSLSALGCIISAVLSWEAAGAGERGRALPQENNWAEQQDGPVIKHCLKLPSPSQRRAMLPHGAGPRTQKSWLPEIFLWADPPSLQGFPLTFKNYNSQIRDSSGSASE